MAAVSIPPSPHSFSIMATRRAPLSSIPNAVNSPCRGAVLASTAVSKRSRSHSTVQQQHDVPYGEPPPAKKQMLNKDYPQPRTPSRPRPIQPAEAHGFPRRTSNTQITTLERKLMAAREKKHQATMEERAIKVEMDQTAFRAQMEEKAINESIENVRQWQKHYRKVFPTFVFYFESIPEEARVRCSKQVTSLGAVSGSSPFNRHIQSRSSYRDNLLTMSISTIERGEILF